MKPYYEDGWFTIYLGDCFDLLHDLRGIGAVVTDPPYSSGGAFRGDRAMQTTTKYVNSDTAAYRPEFAGDNRDQRSFCAWATMWLNAARRASEPGAVLATFIDWRQLPVLTDAVQAGGWTWRNLATWWKPGVRMQRGRFSASAEYVIYGTNGPALDGFGSPQNVFAYPACERVWSVPLGRALPPDTPVTCERCLRRIGRPMKLSEQYLADRAGQT